MKIRTQHWLGQWEAFDVDAAEGSPVGYGATREAAIADLKALLDAEDAADDAARLEDTSRE